MAKQTIKIGDIVKDSYGREGIVVGVDSYPSDDWISAQEDKRIRKFSGQNKYNETWLNVFPLSGGSVSSPESLTKKLRKCNKKDLSVAKKNANFFAKKHLEKLNC